MKQRNVLAIMIIAVFFCLLLFMIVQLLPLVRDITVNVTDETSVVTYVRSFGWRGVPALIGLAILQIIIPIIPAPAVGVLTGLSYGVYWGLPIFLTGVALGNAFVLVSMRQLHSLLTTKKKRSAEQFLSKERLKKIKRPEIVAFFFVLFPWVSAVGPYLFAETKVSLWKYIIAVVAGSVPTTILYVLLGDRISKGNYTIAIIMGVIAVIALIFVLLFRKKIISKIIEKSDIK